MSDAAATALPPLANLVRAGENRRDADKVTDFLFTAVDQTNVHLVNTADGDVLINTGFPPFGQRNVDALAPHRTGPLRRIVVTQSHSDCFGGLDAFNTPETEVIVHKDFHEVYGDTFERLKPCFGPRVRKLWGAALDQQGTWAPPPKVEADIYVDREYVFEQGGRRFEVIWTPGGETTDSMVVWMPKERIVFTGNLFGPVFMAMPNLNTMRGEKPRLVKTYLSSLDRVRKLGAEILVTGHEVFRGADKVRADLDKLYNAVAWIRDQTLDGMNAGKDVYTLMREIQLPEDLRIGEPHGKVSWAVRAIWHEYSGWFLFDRTTSLYGVPSSSVDADLAELAGGADALAARARQKLEQGKALEAMHLVEIALGAKPDCRAALEVQKPALQRLLAESGEKNLSETMWLRSEIAAVEAKLAR